jgi:hypothetical protein
MNNQPKFAAKSDNCHLSPHLPQTYTLHRGADKSSARPTSRYILFDGENISFDASLVIRINNINVPPIMIINRVYETQNLLSLELVSFLVGLRTYQHPYIPPKTLLNCRFTKYDPERKTM